MLYNSVYLWLTTPDDYQAGLALLHETGYKGFALTILAMGDDAYNRTRLENELRTWLEKQTPAQNNVLPLIPDIAPGTIENSDPVLSLPRKPVPNVTKPSGDAVQPIRFQIYGLMDSRAEAKASLRAMECLGNDDAACAQRLPYAIQVKALTRQIDELYSRIDFFDQHGYLPPLATDSAVVVDDTTALMNARSYVSRYKAKLKKKNLTPEQRQSAEKLLKQYSDEKQRLELKLKPNHDLNTSGQQTTNCPNHHPTFSGA